VRAPDLRHGAQRELFGAASVRRRHALPALGKIEALLSGRYVSVRTMRLIDAADRAITAVVNVAGALLSNIDPHRRINGAFTLYRGQLLQRIGKKCLANNELAVECYSLQEEPCRMIVELRKLGISVFRESLELNEGYNAFNLKLPLPPEFTSEDHYELMLYPDGDKELRVVFTWLDFIVRRQTAKHLKNGNETAAQVAGNSKTAAPSIPAAKVKCVAWDLDNTLWKGILAEDGPANLRLRPEAVGLIRQLDERGIIQTIVSKNNHDDAMAVVKESDLEGFFLYPAINWGRKSENLQQIADKLNINIDTFAFIDDSPFERREVSEALPMVRVYPEDALERMLEMPEFDVPVTEASRMRRMSYLTEITREKAKEQFGTDYLEFLRSCQMKLRVFQPHTSEEVARCLELIQRSNQLNLSSRRYAADEFRSLLADKNVLSLAMECEDRFGAYGIVGFASIEIGGEDPVAKDFVLSCRVAAKHVEHAFYSWLGNRMKEQGARRLLIDLIKTQRNKPLVRVFDELPFKTIREEGEKVLFSLDLASEVHLDNIVELNDSALAGVWGNETNSELR
jgi:FkbH-like protein